MELKDFRVFVCVPGVGKTYLSKIDSRFVDLDSEKSIYKYGLEGKSQLELEQGKSNRGKPCRNDEIAYVEKRIKECLAQNKIILVAPNPKVVQKIIELEIPYCLVYHSLDCVEEYRERMRNRGNAENFIEEMLGDEILKVFHKQSEEDSRPAFKVELKKGQFLSDLFASGFFS